MIAQFVVTPKRLLALIAMEKSTFSVVDATAKARTRARYVMEKAFTNAVFAAA